MWCSMSQKKYETRGTIWKNGSVQIQAVSCFDQSSVNTKGILQIYILIFLWKCSLFTVLFVEAIKHKLQCIIEIHHLW